MKTNPFSSFLVSLLAFSCLASCNKTPSVSAPDGQIVFRCNPDFTAKVQTKATAVNQASLVANGFHVSATTGDVGEETAAWTNETFRMGADYFQSEDSKWWPSTDPHYHFYASSVNLTHTPGGATVQASSDYDVVCAYMPDPNYNEVNTLLFRHIFARVTDVTFTAANGYTITGISVTLTPQTGGKYNLRTGAGQTDGTGWSNITTGSPTVIANTTPGTKSNDLYLVPGTYTVTATWTATKGDYTETFSNKTCSVSLAGGAVNTITAQLTGDATEVAFSVEVVDWTAQTIDLGIYED